MPREFLGCDSFCANQGTFTQSQGVSGLGVGGGRGGLGPLPRCLQAGVGPLQAKAIVSMIISKVDMESTYGPPGEAYRRLLAEVVFWGVIL